MNSKQRIKKEHKITVSIRRHMQTRAYANDFKIEKGPQPLSYWLTYNQIPVLVCYTIRERRAIVFFPHYLDLMSLPVFDGKNPPFYRIDEHLDQIKLMITQFHDRNSEAYSILRGMLEHYGVPHYCYNKLVHTIFNGKLVILNLTYKGDGSTYNNTTFDLNNPNLFEELRTFHAGRLQCTK